ncbi:unnamed protein product [Fraxinus pennsylvanica]|uniref:BRX domain-containing protein n=1 Tax=Fraxinus pennsylvanica TaxID=56036 RepID=A0AAD1YXW8_9LAMI|nr:unnamed protein product [Fraxinus pennsylvanica]
MPARTTTSSLEVDSGVENVDVHNMLEATSRRWRGSAERYSQYKRRRQNPHQSDQGYGIEEGPYSSYMQPGSSSSTPAWDFTSTGHHASRSDSRFSRPYAGDQTPDARESISTKYGEVVLENDEAKEWMAQVEPGVQITFVSLPRGGNDLKRIRFSREMFNKWEAQRWWGENYDRIMELYNVQKFNQQAFNTPGRSEDGRDSTYSRLESARESPRMTPSVRYRPSASSNYFPPDHGGSQYYHAGSRAYPGGASRGETSYMEASRDTNASVDEPSVSISNASDIESEWIEEDEPGVYITIRQLVDGTRELRRVRFSREKFGEVNAKHWWETNRDRIQTQYL